MFQPLSIEQAIELLSEEFLGVDGVCDIYDSNDGQEIIIEVAPAGPNEPRSRCPKKIPERVGRFPISVYPGSPRMPYRQAVISMPTSAQLGAFRPSPQSYGDLGAWSSSGPSSLSKAGLDMLIKSEGIRGTVYDDKTGKSVASYSEVQGYPTIALGLYITPDMQSTYAKYLKGGEILSGAALQDVIDKTIQPREQQLNKLLSGIPNVTQNQYDALFSWLFNRGASNSRLLSAIAKLRAGDVAGAGAAIAEAASAESVPYIAARRVQESVLFLTGADIGSTASKVIGITIMSIGIAGILGAVYWRKKHRNPLNLSESRHVSIYTE